MVRPGSFLLVLAPVFLATGARAQLDPLYEVHGLAPGDWFGYSVACAGDVDGDGTSDFIVGAHQNLNYGHSPYPGYARVYSGADASLLWHFEGDGTNWIDGPDDHFGAVVDGLGDVDGDGHDDLLIGAFKDDNGGAFNSGMVRVLSGLDGSILQQHDGEAIGDRMGISAACLGDLDGDLVPDFVTGVYKDDTLAYNGGSARVHSGADGAQLFVFDGDDEGEALGWAARPAGDVDGDGVVDVVVGSPNDDENGDLSGSASVYSGAGGALLFHWVGAAPGDYFGFAVDGAGDVDADGHDDLIVGAIQSTLNGQSSGPGYARVLSGADGALLFELWGEAPLDQLGYAVRGAGDLDQDGRADFLVGAPRAVTLGQSPSGLAGYARLYSGRTGRLLFTFLGSAPDDQFGVALDVLTDLDGDGLAELLFGSCEDDAAQSRPGSARVVPGGLVLLERYCVAAPNSAGAGALLGHAGTLSVARNDLVLFADGCPPEHFGLFYYGSQAPQMPFGDGWRCVGGDVFRLGVVGTGADGSASFALDLEEPPQPAGRITPGSTWHFQFWYRDIPAGMSGFNLSDALTGIFAP